MDKFDIAESFGRNTVLSTQTGMDRDELVKIDMQRSIMGLEQSDDPIANIGNNILLGKDLYKVDVIDNLLNR
ncbi:MAG: hypothetical protein MJ115_00765 [Clostridia bacterium]|nr:hypothetical protein [Clostridia bacterium]